MNQHLKKLTSGLILTVFAFSALTLSSSSFAAEKVYKVGDKYNVSGVSSGKNAVVLQILNADLNKDKKNELIYLIGNKFDKTSVYYDQITYVIKDGKTSKRLVHIVKDRAGFALGGYEPTLQIADLNKDAQNDLFLSAPSGGSGGFVSYDLSTFKAGKLTSFLSEADLKGLTITGKYLDNYQVELSAKELNKKWLLDVSYNKAMYLESDVYDTAGKFIGISEPSSSVISTLEIEDAYGQILLVGNQKITGIANADTIANLNLYLSFEKGKWTLKQVTQTSTIKAFE